MTVCDALLSSLLPRFCRLLEQLEVDISEIGVDFKPNNKFYDLYKDPIFMFSPFLDGMFKLRWITESLLDDSSENRLCEKVKQIIFDHCILIEHGSQTPADHTNENETNHPVPTSETSSPNSSTRKRKCLFGNIEYDLQHNKKVKTIDSYNYINEEISRYTNDENNDGMILLNTTPSCTFKTLAKLAAKYLCVPATSSEVERMFSQSGFLFRPHRSRMSRKTFEQLTLLKCNNDIV